MTSLNNPVNLPLDTNGYVKSSIWGQNINPNVNTVASVTGNVGGSVIGSVASVTNPVTSWTTISHQTGLSAAVSALNAPVNIGSAISITKNGLMLISLKGHVSANTGYIDFTLTRNAVIYYFSISANSTNLSNSMWSEFQNLPDIKGTSTVALVPTFMSSNAGFLVLNDVLQISVLNGDSIQFRASSTGASTVYLDDLTVIQQ